MRSFLQMSELYLKRLQRFAFHLCFLSLILMILSADHTRCFAKRLMNYLIIFIYLILMESISII